MLNIFVLEDTFQQQARIERAVEKSLVARGLVAKHFGIYGKPDQLMAAIKETGAHQLFLLDIEIKDEPQKGLEVAKAIRARDPLAVIAFVTTHSEFLSLTYRYKVSALDFIDKGQADADFEAAIDETLGYVADQLGSMQTDDIFVFKNAQTQVQVPFHDILYFEASSRAHKVILRTTSERLEFYGTLAEIAELDSRLYQSHRAYVVNPANITRIDRATHTLHFPEGETCLVSRLKLKGLMALIDK